LADRLVGWVVDG